MANIKNNLRATTFPGPTNDASDGYEVGSTWRDTRWGTTWICVDAAANAAVWAANGTLAQQMYTDSTAPFHTGDTLEGQLGPTITAPGGCLGPNGWLELTTIWTAGNNANVKTGRVKMGGELFTSATITSASILRHQIAIGNCDDEAIQAGGVIGGSGGWGTSGIGPVASSVDTSEDFDIEFFVLLATSTDAVKLRGYRIEAFYGA